MHRGYTVADTRKTPRLPESAPGFSEERQPEDYPPPFMLGMSNGAQLLEPGQFGVAIAADDATVGGARGVLPVRLFEEMEIGN